MKKAKKRRSSPKFRFVDPREYMAAVIALYESGKPVPPPPKGKWG